MYRNNVGIGEVGTYRNVFWSVLVMIVFNNYFKKEEKMK